MPNGNNYASQFNLSPYGGWNPMGPMSMAYPGQQQSQGGGGWFGNALNFLGQGIAGSNPIAMGAMALGSLIPGLIGAFSSGSKQKKKEKWFSNQQQQYQQAVNRYFPELGKESFQFKSPELNNAIQGALASRMGNMFGSWGMPPDMRQGYGSLQELFSALMPQTGAPRARAQA